MSKIKEYSFEKLLPTQMTAAMIEVADKVQDLRALAPAARTAFLRMASATTTVRFRRTFAI